MKWILRSCASNFFIFFCKFDSVTVSYIEHIQLLQHSAIYQKKLTSLNIEESYEDEHWTCVQQLLEQYAPQLHHVSIYSVPNTIIAFPNLISLQIEAIDLANIGAVRVLIGILQMASKLQQVSIVDECDTNVPITKEYTSLVQCLKGKQLELSVQRAETLQELLPFATNYKAEFDTFGYINFSHMVHLQKLSFENVTIQEKQLLMALPQSISHLSFKNCTLHEFPSIEKLNLNVLEIRACKIYNLVLPEWMNAKTIRELVINQFKNPLTMNIPLLAEKIELQRVKTEANQVFTASRTSIELFNCSVQGTVTIPMPRLQYLEIYLAIKFEQFELVRNLRVLKLQCDESIDLSSITACSKLYHIKFECPFMNQIPHEIVQLPSLQVLMLLKCDITSIESNLFDGACSFPALQKLVVEQCAIVALPPVSTLPCLTRLAISPSNPVSMNHTIDAQLLHSIHNYVDANYPELAIHKSLSNVIYCIHNPIRKQLYVNYSIVVRETALMGNIFHFVCNATKFNVVSCNFSKRVLSLL